ncbi:FAD-dependent monooxygenase [Roseovarius salinarum]|uniref:FAD-dependent monooxygenase n=1 Tax=Roseovarius salinarum TaxID=1981892 RepID=UPI000C32EE89|nr:FAD-dependent monooxygenase [Roseovarius salinarum]
MALDGIRVAVIGAGVGGLAAACALARRGAEVTVLEQAHEISEVGAGLQVSPNGFAVLAALGLGAALRGPAVRGRAVSLRDYRGDEVLRLDLDRLARRDFWFVHRADLIELLAQAARDAGVRIRLLQKVAQVVPGAPPKVKLANGAVVHADLVVGADGLNSKVRPAVDGPSRASFTGQTAWRAVIANDEGAGPVARVHMGPHRHVVSYPLRAGSLLNIVAVQERAEWAEESWSRPGDPKELRAAFSDFCPEVRGMLDRVEAVGHWGLFRHPVAERWHGDGVVLLGDAAHPTLPFMAQGACMALEDAWVLADALEAEGGQGAALSAYQARRRPRAGRVVAAANRNAWKYHLSSPPMRGAAHAALRLGGWLAPGAMIRQFDWIYGHDVTRGG